MAQGMKDNIAGKLAQALHPLVLDVVNESAHHAGHAGDDGSGESHFRVAIVSSAFAGKSRVERQRMVYALLADELGSGALHALSVSAVTPDEYDRV